MRTYDVLSLLLSLLLLPLSALSAQTNDYGSIWSSYSSIFMPEQDDNTLVGTYSCCGSSIEGKVRDNISRSAWQDFARGRGWGEFRPGTDAMGFAGVWGMEGDPTSRGRWDATQPSGVTSEHEGVRTFWRVRSTSQGLVVQGEAELFIDNTRVIGQLQGQAQLPGLAPGQKIEVINELLGHKDGQQIMLDWHNPIDGSKGVMVLEHHGDRLEGTWRTADGGDSGRISFTPVDDATGGEINLKTALANQEARDRAEALLREGADAIDAGRINDALQTFDEAAAIFRTQDDRNKLGYALYGVGSAHLWRGDYEEAAAHFAQVLELGPAVAETIRLLAQSSLEAARLMLGQEVQPQAGSTPATALDAPPELIDAKHEAQRLFFGGDFKGALAVADDALRHLPREQGMANPAQHGRLIDLNGLLEIVGFANLRLNQPEAALDATKRRIAVLAELGPLGEAGLPQVLVARSQAEWALNLSDAAEASLREALEIQKRRQVPELFQTRALLARLLEARGRLAEAEDQLRLAVEGVENLRGRMRQEATKLALMSGDSLLQTAAPYFAYVTLLMDRPPDPDAPRRALLVAERLRARATLDRIAAIESGSPAQTALAETLQVTPVAPEELAPLVQRSGSAHLVWFVADEATYAWLIEPDGQTRSYRLLLGRKEVAGLAHQVRQGVRSAAVARRVRPAFDALIQPLAEGLKALPSGTPLTVVPHDALHLLPFVLLLDGSQDKDLAFVLSYLPALSFLRYHEPSRAAAKDRLLVVAKPEGTDGLVNAMAEAEAALAVFPGRGRLMTDSEAGREAVLSALPDYSVVLFATHGRVNGPDAPYLDLARRSRLGAGDLARLAARPRKLAILSACETHVASDSDAVALGRGADELMSLARAFLVAGYEAVLVTLWKAEDRTAARLVPDFLARWQAGLAPPAALDEALRQLAADGASAFAWAPWILIGRHG